MAEFEGKRPGQREPSFVGIHDFAALSGAALVVGAIGVALGDGRPAGRRWSLVALATGGARRRPVGRDDRGARALARGGRRAPRRARAWARCGRGARSRSSAITLLVTAGTAAMRADTIERFAEFLGLRDRVEETGVESYAHRTLLAYIGGRIWLDHPITGVGWQASSEEWAYGPFLEDARARFPDEPEQAFPAPDRPWGIQLLYLQVAADLGIAGIAVLLALAAAAVTAGIRGLRSSPVALVGLGWLCVAAGVWAGIGLVAGLPLGALTWIAIGLVTVREGDPRLDPPLSMPTYAVRAPLVRWLDAEAARAAADLGPYRLLDVGCGEKPYLPLFEPHAGEYVGLDTARTPRATSSGRSRRSPRRTRRSTSSSASRCSSTSTTRRRASASCTASPAPEAACSSRRTARWSTTRTRSTSGAGPHEGSSGSSARTATGVRLR